MRWNLHWLALALLLGSLTGPARSRAATSSITPLSAFDHWAFKAPREVTVPSPQDQSWAKTPIDRFILSQLESKGIHPAPPANPRTLMRRVTYGLTGLPPTAEEVEAFAVDPTPQAFAAVVDRLLASPHYGERWGRHWLDVARYSDTKGYVYYYEESRFVQPHHYRDWVVRSINQDLPYDRFLLLQIAADRLLPGERNSAQTAGTSTLPWPPTVYSPEVAALGFLTLGRRFLDQAPDIVDDQIDVVMRGTQALTVSCARCHDHKFDPIPTTDYYSLYGIFQNSEERLVALQSPPRPDQLVPFGKAKDYVEFEQGLSARLEKLETAYRKAVTQVTERLRDRVKDYLVAVLDAAKLPSDANVRPQPDDINPYNVRQWERYLSAHDSAEDPIFAPWHAVARIPEDRFAIQATELSRTFFANSSQKLNPRVAQLFAQPPTNRVELAQRYGDLFLSLRQTQGTNTTSKHPSDTDPSAAALKSVLYDKGSPILPPPGLITELDVHLYFDDPNRVALAQMQMEIEQWLIRHTGTAQYSLVLEDRRECVLPVVFRRGDPLKPGETVPRQFLAMLSPSPRQAYDQGSGRLELARAIASPENPLTARVMVNRVWAHHFGKGLVDTPSDFGTRSSPPSHPQLLDWLALRFIADGWSLKKLHRLILLSAVYQQSAQPDARSAASAQELDPDNRFLWRFNRQRLDFESLRDSLLVSSGELDLAAGGPGMEQNQKPYGKRRTIYGLIDRKFVPTVARSFDFANPDVHNPQRHVTSVPQQALFLFSSPFVAERCRQLAGRIPSTTANDEAKTASAIRSLYARVLQRPPSETELQESRRFLAEFQSEPQTAGKTEAPLTAWEQLSQVLFFSNDFLFID